MAYYAEDMHVIATYFAPDAPDTYGKVTYAAGVEIACRWQDQQNTIMDNDGNQVVTQAVVYLADLVVVQGRLALGSFVDDAAAFAVARIIKSVIVSTSLDGDEKLVKALV